MGHAAAARTRTDPVSRDVFRHQLSGIADEMSTALRRSSYSSIIWNMYDYTCALLTPKGEIIAQAETIAAQLGILPMAFAAVTRDIPIETWKQGDAILTNDPYSGCTHTPDMVLFSPVFHSDTLVAVAATVAHHVDIGGKVPCSTAPDNLDIFSEGIRITPMRLFDRGEANTIVYQFIASNVRDPRSCLGDLRAQVAGCRTGEAGVWALVDQHGLERFCDLIEDSFDYTERYARSTISCLPDGTYRAALPIEDGIASQEPINLAVAITVAGDEILVDFDGTSTQRDFGLNCPQASTVSMVNYAMKCLLAPAIKPNDGLNRPIRINVPDGTVLNPRFPGAVSSRHFTQQAVAEVVLKAMLPLMPEHAAAGGQISFSSLRAGGVDDRPARRAADGKASYYVVQDIVGGGMGACASADGKNAVDTHGGNCPLLSAEVMETVSPFRVLRTDLVPGSGGAGKHRGGLAVRRSYELLAEKAVVGCYFQQASEKTRPWGIFGGEKGAAAHGILNPGRDGERVLPVKSIGLTVRKGDVIEMQSAGGGGWGNSAARDPAFVARDRAEGYVR